MTDREQLVQPERRAAGISPFRVEELGVPVRSLPPVLQRELEAVMAFRQELVQGTARLESLLSQEPEAWAGALRELVVLLGRRGITIMGDTRFQDEAQAIIRLIERSRGEEAAAARETLSEASRKLEGLARIIGLEARLEEGGRPAGLSDEGYRGFLMGVERLLRDFGTSNQARGVAGLDFVEHYLVWRHVYDVEHEGVREERDAIFERVGRIGDAAVAGTAYTTEAQDRELLRGYETRVLEWERTATQWNIDRVVSWQMALAGMIAYFELDDLRRRAIETLSADLSRLERRMREQEDVREDELAEAAMRYYALSGEAVPVTLEERHAVLEARAGDMAAGRRAEEPGATSRGNPAWWGERAQAALENGAERLASLCNSVALLRMLEEGRPPAARRTPMLGADAYGRLVQAARGTGVITEDVSVSDYAELMRAVSVARLRLLADGGLARELGTLPNGARFAASEQETRLVNDASRRIMAMLDADARGAERLSEMVIRYIGMLHVTPAARRAAMPGRESIELAIREEIAGRNGSSQFLRGVAQAGIVRDAAAFRREHAQFASSEGMPAALNMVVELARAGRTEEAGELLMLIGLYSDSLRIMQPVPERRRTPAEREGLESMRAAIASIVERGGPVQVAAEAGEEDPRETFMAGWNAVQAGAIGRDVAGLETRTRRFERSADGRLGSSAIETIRARLEADDISGAQRLARLLNGFYEARAQRSTAAGHLHGLDEMRHAIELETRARSEGEHVAVAMMFANGRARSEVTGDLVEMQGQMAALYREQTAELRRRGSLDRFQYADRELGGRGVDSLLEDARRAAADGDGAALAMASEALQERMRLIDGRMAEGDRRSQLYALEQLTRSAGERMPAATPMPLVGERRRGEREARRGFIITGRRGGLEGLREEVLRMVPEPERIVERQLPPGEGPITGVRTRVAPRDIPLLREGQELIGRREELERYLRDGGAMDQGWAERYNQFMLDVAQYQSRVQRLMVLQREIAATDGYIRMVRASGNTWMGRPGYTAHGRSVDAIVAQLTQSRERLAEARRMMLEDRPSSGMGDEAATALLARPAAEYERAMRSRANAMALASSISVDAWRRPAADFFRISRQERERRPDLEFYVEGRAQLFRDLGRTDMGRDEIEDAEALSQRMNMVESAMFMGANFFAQDVTHGGASSRIARWQLRILDLAQQGVPVPQIASVGNQLTEYVETWEGYRTLAVGAAGIAASFIHPAIGGVIFLADSWHSAQQEYIMTGRVSRETLLTMGLMVGTFALGGAAAGFGRITLAAREAQAALGAYRAESAAGILARANLGEATLARIAASADIARLVTSTAAVGVGSYFAMTMTDHGLTAMERGRYAEGAGMLLMAAIPVAHGGAARLARMFPRGRSGLSPAMERVLEEATPLRVEEPPIPEPERGPAAPLAPAAPVSATPIPAGGIAPALAQASRLSEPAQLLAEVRRLERARTEEYARATDGMSRADRAGLDMALASDPNMLIEGRLRALGPLREYVEPLLNNRELIGRVRDGRATPRDVTTTADRIGGWAEQTHPEQYAALRARIAAGEARGEARPQLMLTPEGEPVAVGGAVPRRAPGRGRERMEAAGAEERAPGAPERQAEPTGQPQAQAGQLPATQQPTAAELRGPTWRQRAGDWARRRAGYAWGRIRGRVEPHGELAAGIAVEAEGVAPELASSLGRTLESIRGLTPARIVDDIMLPLYRYSRGASRATRDALAEVLVKLYNIEGVAGELARRPAGRRGVGADIDALQRVLRGSRSGRVGSLDASDAMRIVSVLARDGMPRGGRRGADAAEILDPVTSRLGLDVGELSPAEQAALVAELGTRGVVNPNALGAIIEGHINQMLGVQGIGGFQVASGSLNEALTDCLMSAIRSGEAQSMQQALSMAITDGRFNQPLRLWILRPENGGRAAWDSISGTFGTRTGRTAPDLGPLMGALRALRPGRGSLAGIDQVSGGINGFIDAVAPLQDQMVVEGRQTYGDYILQVNLMRRAAGEPGVTGVVARYLGYSSYIWPRNWPEGIRRFGRGMIAPIIEMGELRGTAESPGAPRGARRGWTYFGLGVSQAIRFAAVPGIPLGGYYLIRWMYGAAEPVEESEQRAREEFGVNLRRIPAAGRDQWQEDVVWLYHTPAGQRVLRLLQEYSEDTSRAVNNLLTAPSLANMEMQLRTLLASPEMVPNPDRFPEMLRAIRVAVGESEGEDVDAAYRGVLEQLERDDLRISAGHAYVMHYCDAIGVRDPAVIRHLRENDETFLLLWRNVQSGRLPRSNIEEAARRLMAGIPAEDTDARDQFLSLVESYGTDSTARTTLDGLYGADLMGPLAEQVGTEPGEITPAAAWNRVRMQQFLDGLSGEDVITPAGIAMPNRSLMEEYSRWAAIEPDRRAQFIEMLGAYDTNPEFRRILNSIYGPRRMPRLAAQVSAGTLTAEAAWEQVESRRREGFQTLFHRYNTDETVRHRLDAFVLTSDETVFGDFLAMATMVADGRLTIDQARQDMYVGDIRLARIDDAMLYDRPAARWLRDHCMHDGQLSTEGSLLGWIWEHQANIIDLRGIIHYMMDGEHDGLWMERAGGRPLPLGREQLAQLAERLTPTFAQEGWYNETDRLVPPLTTIFGGLPDVPRSFGQEFDRSLDRIEPALTDVEQARVRARLMEIITDVHIIDATRANQPLSEEERERNARIRDSIGLRLEESERPDQPPTLRWGSSDLERRLFASLVQELRQEPLELIPGSLMDEVAAAAGEGASEETVAQVVGALGIMGASSIRWGNPDLQGRFEGDIGSYLDNEDARTRLNSVFGEAVIRPLAERVAGRGSGRRLNARDAWAEYQRGMRELNRDDLDMRGIIVTGTDANPQLTALWAIPDEAALEQAISQIPNSFLGSNDAEMEQRREEIRHLWATREQVQPGHTQNLRDAFQTWVQERVEQYQGEAPQQAEVAAPAEGVVEETAIEPAPRVIQRINRQCGNDSGMAQQVRARIETALAEENFEASIGLRIRDEDGMLDYTDASGSAFDAWLSAQVRELRGARGR